MEALHSGQEALLAADKARGLGYKSGNVRVRVKQVDSPKGQVYVGFIDGFEAWVQRDELEAVASTQKSHWKPESHGVPRNQSEEGEEGLLKSSHTFELCEAIQSLWKHLGLEAEEDATEVVRKCLEPYLGAKYANVKTTKGAKFRALTLSYFAGNDGALGNLMAVFEKTGLEKAKDDLAKNPRADDKMKQEKLARTQQDIKKVWDAVEKARTLLKDQRRDAWLPKWLSSFLVPEVVASRTKEADGNGDRHEDDTSGWLAKHAGTLCHLLPGLGGVNYERSLNVVGDRPRGTKGEVDGLLLREGQLAAIVECKHGVGSIYDDLTGLCKLVELLYAYKTIEYSEDWQTELCNYMEKRCKKEHAVYDRNWRSLPLFADGNAMVPDPRSFPLRIVNQKVRKTQAEFETKPERKGTKGAKQPNEKTKKLNVTLPWDADKPALPVMYFLGSAGDGQTTSLRRLLRPSVQKQERGKLLNRSFPPTGAKEGSGMELVPPSNSQSSWGVKVTFAQAEVAHAEQQINSRLGDIASLLESGRLFFYVNTPRGFERILHESKSTEEVSPASENR
ncbi:DEGP10 [Symbiodinium natans]|uniref:DEGP10 protein n=1 Tax=Symbiodinium natans TaxID=878477 RepID=A0A812UT19_9DINO|nr:DEGP10 [Symbiodinium natans]